MIDLTANTLRPAGWGKREFSASDRHAMRVEATVFTVLQKHFAPTSSTGVRDLRFCAQVAVEVRHALEELEKAEIEKRKLCEIGT